MSRLVGERRGEHLHPGTKGTEKISWARQQSGYSLSARQQRGYSLSARQRRGYRSWDQQELRASLARELCWSGCENLGYFSSSTLDIHNKSPGSVQRRARNFFTKISQLSRKIYIYYINHLLEKDWATLCKKLSCEYLYPGWFINLEKKTRKQVRRMQLTHRGLKDQINYFKRSG